jgi:osmotically-inducible protein OsmY
MSQDRDLQKAVLDELAWEPSVTAAHVGVTASGGVVTLTGHVSSYAEKFAAEAATRRVRGVKAVAEEIKVKLASDFERTDDQIAAAVVDRLSWDVSVPRDAAKVMVENGWITLTGEVDWHYQKDAAEQAIHRLYGVVGVSNQMTVKPRVNTSNLSEDITHALGRSWFFDPKLVTVSAIGGKVRLGGSVHTFHDRETAGRTAWAAPGVTSVENDIAVY